MSKIPIYFLPGLAAGPEIFENLRLSNSVYDLYYLHWKMPLHQKETVANYAMRMCEDILHKNPVLVGVSFGGIMVQEMSQFITTKKVIIYLSVDSYEKRTKPGIDFIGSKRYSVDYLKKVAGYCKDSCQD